MTAYDFWQAKQQRDLASTTATRKASASDVHRATGSVAVDYHVDKSTDKE
jgi:hypothetical protein